MTEQLSLVHLFIFYVLSLLYFEGKRLCVQRCDCSLYHNTGVIPSSDFIKNLLEDVF